jgi:hypothetical protein
MRVQCRFGFEPAPARQFSDFSRCLIQPAAPLLTKRGVAQLIRGDAG